MSQVAVHHPSSYAHSGQVGLPATVTSTVSATFLFQGLAPSTAHTIVWGDATGNGSFTTDATGAGSAAHTYAANGTYKIIVTVTATGQTVAVRTFTVPYAGGAGFAPSLAAVPETPPETTTTEPFDPSEHTVAEVMEYVNSLAPDDPQIQEIYDAEVAGKDRSSLVSQLEAVLPYDPGAHTVAEVEDYVAANPDDLEEIIAAEEAGKARVTLLNALYALRP